MSQVRSNQQGSNPTGSSTGNLPATTSTYTPAPGTTSSNLAYNATGQTLGQQGQTTYVQQGSGINNAYTATNQIYGQPGAATSSTNYQYMGVPQYAANTTTVSGQRQVASDIPVESRIQYVPFEKKYVEYEQVEKVYQVPYETEVVEYEEVVRNERIPVERTVTDYYAVQTQVEYIRREVEETVMVQEPVEKVYERVQYIPVETQIVHYPERENYTPAKTQTRTEYVGVVGGPQGQVASGYQTYSGVQQQGSRVGGAVVTGGSNVGVTTTGGATYTYGGTNTYPTGQAYTQGYTTTGYVVPTTSTTGYVTGGSGVRGASGYVTGGSGVRGNTTYVTSGSGVKGASYETSVGGNRY